jgi:hypothetical protein
MELSQDGRFVGPNAMDDAQGLPALVATLNGRRRPGEPRVTAETATGLYRFLRGLPADITRTNPLFGQHPVQAIGDYMEANAKAVASQNVMLDTLATHVTRDTSNVNAATGAITVGFVPAGGKNITVKEALRRLGLTDESSKHMRDRLYKLTGLAPD